MRSSLTAILAAAAFTLLAAGPAQALPPVKPPPPDEDYPIPAPPPKPKPTPTPTPTPNPNPPGMKKVTVKLLDVKAKEIEDVCCFGLARDGFFILGNLKVGNNTNVIVRNPRNIGTGETLTYNETLFSGFVPETAAIDFSLTAYDKDAGRVFEHVPAVVTAIGAACTAGIAVDPSGFAAACAMAIPIAQPIANRLATFSDPDDQLGLEGWHFELPSFTPGTHLKHMRMIGDSGSWSDWDYTLRYEITIS